MRGVLALVCFSAAAGLHIYNGQHWESPIYFGGFRVIVGSNIEYQQLLTVLTLVLFGVVFGLGQVMQLSQQAGARKKRR